MVNRSQRVSRADTRDVLASINEAVRPIEHARTAAAVDRVLQTATPSIHGMWSEDWEMVDSLCAELGLTRAKRAHDVECDCESDEYGHYPADELVWLDVSGVFFEFLAHTSDWSAENFAEYDWCVCDTCVPIDGEPFICAPWHVSPHLFTDVTFPCTSKAPRY